MTEQPRLLDAGERALVVEFGSVVDPAVHDRVLFLDAALAAAAVEGVEEAVPTFRSLMIHYDPLVIARDALAARVRSLLASLDASRRFQPRPTKRWTVPCCYEGEFGEDLDHVAGVLGLPREDVAERHAGSVYRVYMYGFAPGHCYLGGLPPELAISRRATPRGPHAPGAVVIGGGLSLVSTLSMPTGWWVVGRTPERMFALDRAAPTFAEIGDQIRFERIEGRRFEELAREAAAGRPVAREDDLA